jgi:hypothetical protein
MLCRRLRAVGCNGFGTGNEVFRRTRAAVRGQGSSSPHILIPAPEDGGPRGAAPRAKTSTITMWPPQQGHGGR